MQSRGSAGDAGRLLTMYSGDAPQTRLSTKSKYSEASLRKQSVYTAKGFKDTKKRLKGFDICGKVDFPSTHVCTSKCVDCKMAPVIKRTNVKKRFQVSESVRQQRKLENQATRVPIRRRSKRINSMLDRINTYKETNSFEPSNKLGASNKLPLITSPIKASDASQRKIYKERRYYDKVSELHGYLSEQNLAELVESTGYNRHELYALFARFKALCSLSSSTSGVDKETFRKGVPMLSVEDTLFVDRVFEVLDEDGSGIIEWEEFIEAMSSLEKGTKHKRAEFLFAVYDIDKDGGISKDELLHFFLSSLMVEVDESIRDVSNYFVEKVFKEIDTDQDGKMTVKEAIRYIENNPEVTDIYEMFGRSMTSDQKRNLMNDETKVDTIDKDSAEKLQKAKEVISAVIVDEKQRPKRFSLKEAKVTRRPNKK